MPTRAQVEIPGDYQYRALQQGPRLQRFWHRNKITVMQRVLRGAPAEMVVDVGCGSGNLVFESGRRARLAVGLDVSEDALRFCNGRREGTRCVFACSTGEAIPLPSACADVALLVEVIEHLDAPLDVLREIRRILKAGGRLFLTTPNYAFPSLWPALEWLADHSGLVPRMGGAQHVQKFGPETLRALLAQAGFEVERLGTFYHLSPLASLVSDAWADALALREVDSRGRSGALICCVARPASSNLKSRERCGARRPDGSAQRREA
jgi:SAM-dependent methyltransferase